MRGVLPDGRGVMVQVMTAKPDSYQGQTVADQAQDYPC